MDTSLPITSVIPSLDGAVLAALTTTTSPMELAEVHRRAGRGSKSGIRSVLGRIIGEGLVLGVPGGYVLNREHLAAPGIVTLASLYGELSERVRNAVAAWGGEVHLVGLYCSAARRDGDSSSGIDFLIVADAEDLPDFVDP